MTPTIASLMKIAAALGKSVAYFIEESDALRPVTVVRARRARAAATPPSRASTCENISGRYGPFFVAGAEADVEPRADSGPDADGPPGEELVLVLEGAMASRSTASPTSSTRATRSTSAPRCPHSWANPSDEPARAIWLAIRSSRRRACGSSSPSAATR